LVSVTFLGKVKLGLLGRNNDIFHSSSFRIAAEFREIQDVVDSFYKGGSTCLNGMQERYLRMIKVAVVQEFCGGENLDQMSAAEKRTGELTNSM